MGKQPRTKATMPFYFLYLSSNCNQKTGDRIAAISRLVPGAGLEPARPFGSTDFKSVVSTNSTIQAVGLIETEQI